MPTRFYIILGSFTASGGSKEHLQHLLSEKGKMKA
jgi:hypothetical protein